VGVCRSRGEVFIIGMATIIRRAGELRERAVRVN
jgi:hypothetical protein